MDTTPQAGASAEPVVQWGKVSALVGGQAMAQGGSFVLLIAMNWTAVQLGGTGAVSALMLAATLPRALMLIFGGAVADVLGPRFVLLRTTAARVVVLVAGTAVVFVAEHLWQLAVIAVLDGVLLGLGGPASSGLMPQFAKREHLSRANSLYAMVLRVAPIVGAPVGAWLIAVGHLWHALLVASITSGIWLACLLYVTQGMSRPRHEPGTPLVKRSADGFRLLARNPRLRWMFIASFCLDLAFGWPVEVALPLLVSERGWGVGAVGVVIAAFSAGALGSSALGAMLAHRISLFVRLVVTGAGIAVGILVMAVMPSVVTLSVVSCLVGLLSGFNGPAIVTVYQQSAPDSKMGAAMSTLALAGIGTGPISIAVFSSLSLALGIQATWMLCGVVALISPLSAFMALRHPSLADEPAADDEAATGERAGTDEPAGGEGSGPVRTEKAAVSEPSPAPASV